MRLAKTLRIRLFDLLYQFGAYPMLLYPHAHRLIGFKAIDDVLAGKSITSD